VENLQLLLTDSKVSDLELYLCETSNSYSLYLGTSLIEIISCSKDMLEYKMLVGRQVNAGEKLSHLKEIFGHDYRTMKKWAAAIRSSDPEFIVQAFRNRGGQVKITNAVARYVKERYRTINADVYNFRQKIAAETKQFFKVTLSAESLRGLFREADDQDEEEVKLASSIAMDFSADGLAEAESHSREKGKDKSSACLLEENLTLKTTIANKYSTNNENLQARPVSRLPLAAGSYAEPLRALHHAGAVFFSFLIELFMRDRPDAQGIEKQWISQILQGAVNIEQSRTVSLTDLAEFCGKIIKGTDPQRQKLKNYPSLDHIVDIYQANARLLPDGPGKEKVFYYDPTSVPYTGMHKIMKGWCGSVHGVTKLTYIDAIHTRSGRPCFLQHYTPYYDLRERFFMTLNVFNRLFSASDQTGRSFIIDRGIYGLDTFERFREEGDYLITWEKNYQDDGWDDTKATVDFQKFRTRNKADDLKEYLFSCQETTWSKMTEMRRFIVRAINPSGRSIQLSILCSNPDIIMQEAVLLMFNRWLQENDFKYLNAHFGLNQLTSYAVKNFETEDFEDKDVDSLNYKKLKSELTKLHKQWAGLLLKKDKSKLAKEFKRRQIRGIVQEKEKLEMDRIQGFENLIKALTKDELKLRKAIFKNDEKMALIQNNIDTIQQANSQIEIQINDTLRKTSKLGLLIEQGFRRHDNAAKALMDGLRISASNMFAILIMDFRPIYKNHRNDHVMLRQLSRADGFIETRDGRTNISLWLKGSYQKAQIKSFQEFLQLISRKINNHFGKSIIPVNIQLLKGNPML
tara:strand:- start:122 stop:2521 length:2400 start_codon:yes stop_codon:yes gene_type:complete